MTVEIRHLRAFVAIAEQGSISAAARRLLITQPALSRTLRQLETRVGMSLVDRSSTGLTLSPDGAAFLARARAALGAFDEALGERPAGRPLRLGHAWSAAGTHTPAILRAWSRRRPDVPLELRRSDDRFAGLMRDLADVAFLRGDVADPRLHLEPVYTEDRVAAVPVEHPLNRRAAITKPVSTMALHRNPGVAYVPMRDAPTLVTYVGWRKRTSWSWGHAQQA